MTDILPLVSAEHALQEAVYGALTANSALVTALGGARVYDRAPESAAFPYIAFAALASRDGSTATEAGYECRITLNIWSRHGGRREAFQLMQLLRQTLHDRELALAEHILVNLREEFSEVGEDSDRKLFRGSLRLRAFIEIQS
ncbi:MAG: DUF3168 domain-containing protein [Rhizobiales bacterium]|nr:DUF3168 domain-containing protein [Hyphomicrobiales bacterium]